PVRGRAPGAANVSWTSAGAEPLNACAGVSGYAPTSLPPESHTGPASTVSIAPRGLTESPNVSASAGADQTPSTASAAGNSASFMRINRTVTAGRLLGGR